MIARDAPRAIRVILGKLSAAWDDPEWGDEHLYPWKSQEVQLAVRRDFRHSRRIAIRSANAMGKTADILPKTALDYLFGHYPARVVITGASWDSLRDTLLPKLRDLIAGINDRFPGMLRPMSASSRKWEPFGPRFASRIEILSTLRVSRVQGRHEGGNVLALLDESHDAKQEMLEAFFSFTQSRLARMGMSGNPLCVSGAYFDLFHSQRRFWSQHHLCALDSPNVIAGKEIVPGMATQTYIDDVIERHGIDSAEYTARILGNFPTDDQWTILSRKHVEIAMGVPAPARGGKRVMGADFAESAVGDETVFYVRDDAGVIDREAFRGIDTAKGEGEFKRLMREWRPDIAFCDDGGLIGMSARMRDAGFHNVYGVLAGSAAHDPVRHANARAEMLYNLAQRLKSGRFHVPPKIGEMLADQAGIRRKPQRSGKLLAESKDEIRDRIGRSTDDVDALALTFREMPGEETYSMLDPNLHRQHIEPIIEAAPGERKGLFKLRLAGAPPGYFEREGRLVRAWSLSAITGHGFILAHIDPDGAICVFDARETDRTLEELAMLALDAQRDPSGKPHRYAWDLLTADGEGEDFLPTLHDAIISAAQRDGRPLRDVALPDWIDGSEINGLSGVEAIRRLLVGKLADDPDHPYWRGDALAAARHSVRERLYLWPGAMIERLAAARFITSGDGESVATTLKGEMAEASLVRCLRILAVKGVGLRF